MAISKEQNSTFSYEIKSELLYSAVSVFETYARSGHRQYDDLRLWDIETTLPTTGGIYSSNIGQRYKIAWDIYQRLRKVYASRDEKISARGISCVWNDEYHQTAKDCVQEPIYDSEDKDSTIILVLTKEQSKVYKRVKRFQSALSLLKHELCESQKQGLATL